MKKKRAWEPSWPKVERPVFKPADPEHANDVAWLIGLDQEVRELKRDYTARFGQCYEVFNDRRNLSVPELKRIFEIVKNEDAFTFTPENVGFGFRVGYDVCYVEATAPGVPPEIVHVFRVSEKQLPEGWGWAQLSQHFTSAEKLVYYKLPAIGDEGHYQY